MLCTALSGYGDARVVLGLDDQTPAGPDHTRGGQRHILVHRQILDGAVEVADAREHKAPLLRVLRPVVRGEEDRQRTLRTGAYGAVKPVSGLGRVRGVGGGAYPEMDCSRIERWI